MTDIDVNHSVTIGGATLVWDAVNKAVKVYDSKNGEPISLYTTGSLSALGLGSLEGGGGGGGGLIKLVHGFDDLGGAFDNTTMTETFNAYTINEIWKLANAGASTIGTGNVVTAVNKTALGIVATKGITLYDWVQQPNKPTYSLAEINNVSGTYTGADRRQGEQRRLCHECRICRLVRKFCQHERFREQGHLPLSRGGLDYSVIA